MILNSKICVLKCLIVDDVFVVNYMFFMFMFKDVELRRKFIIDEGLTLASIDI